MIDTNKTCIWNIVNIASPDPEPVPGVSEWQISGVVDSVDKEAGTITLWFSDFDKLQTVPIDPNMPGWMLEVPEAAFRTTIPRFCVRNKSLEGVVWGQFLTQCFACRTEEELFDDLLRVLCDEV